MQTCLMLDVDGVLITGRPGDGASWATSLQEDLEIDPVELQDLFFRPFWTRVVTGRMDIGDALARCLPQIHETLTVERFLQYWFENDARVDEAVLEDCAALRAQGVRIVLATNQEHLRAAHIMEQLGLGAHVDGIVYSARLGAKKPDAAFFEAASRATGLPARSHFLVDDTADNIAGAATAGWAGRLWTGEWRLRDLL